MERESYNNCEMFFENPIPKILLPEIKEVIDGMNIQKNWFFVILFGNNNIFFDNQEGKYMNIINNGPIFPNTPQEITTFIAKDKKNKKNYSFIWFPKKLLSSEKFVTEEKTNFFGI